ncbi:MAG: T9SS type B sorting domain-containing protein [Bacteroidetes bacterium]|nr:T9SS type B sorting domain-containing protein [Bacteroidota bacterium]
MKKNLQILLFICLCFEGHGQIININNAADAQSSFGPQQLIEDILISSTCTTVNNFSFQVKGEPSDTNTKSYGYFKKPAGSNFPFDEGILLTSGQAFPVGNTVNGTLIDNNNDQAGDADLENEFQSDPNFNDTFDATYIKFDFVPLANTITFRFLMASEEYNGDYECQFADGFAFLLREVGTTNYQNLAVLPDGTPVSVKNINNSSLINNGVGTQNCDANINYFEGYNLGDTNYGGRTKVLTATAPVIPNRTYEIKLVVADEGDSAWDSAIFLEAGSFIIGGNLGGNHTIANGNPGCDGESITLDATLTLPETTYKWFRDTVEIAGETNPTLDVTVGGTYKVDIAVAGAGGCNSSDEVVIEFTTPPIISSTPNNIVLCETDVNLVEVFDFSGNAALVLGTQVAANFPISYHTSQTDAENNQSALTIPYSNTLQQETIWMRIADVTQTCYEVVSFDIEVQALPIANPVTDYQLCDDAVDDDDTNGLATFDLQTKVNEVLGAQLAVDFEVKFYLSQATTDAGVAGTEITTLIQNTTNPQVVFARIDNRLNTDCYATTTFNLVVHPLPMVTPIVEIKQCDDDTDGISDFNLTEANVLISTDYLNKTFTYYLTQAEADGGLLANQIANFINYPNPTPLNSEVYARVETVNRCYRTARIDLVVGATQIPAAFNLAYETCDDKIVDNDNTNGIASFDFSDATAQVEALFPLGQNLTITYYTTQADALAETNAIADISDHRNEASATTQNIYVRVDNNVVNACLGLGHHITLTVNPQPLANPITDYVLCSDNDQAVFDLTARYAEALGTQTAAILISYHESEQDAINNVPIANAAAYTNTSNPQTIYIRAQFDDNGNGTGDAGECYNTDMSFDLIVNHNPTIFAPEAIRICSDQVSTVYDLSIREDQIKGGDNSISLSYYETQLDMDNNNPITGITQYTNTILTRDILVLAIGTNLCSFTTVLPLRTILYANINRTPTAIEECEIDNNGFDFFDITRREVAILNGLDTADFTFTYYEEESDAIAGNGNNITNVNNFENTQAITQTIYIQVQPVGNECYIVVPLALVVNPVPEIDIEEKYVICLDNAQGVISPETQPFLPASPIDTQLSQTEYSFQWYSGTETQVNTDPNSVIITGATGSTYWPTVAGDYTVLATNIATGCRIPASTVVVSSYPPERITVELLSTAFSGNNIIEVTVVGIGEYEYRLDFGPWQSSNRFENVIGGEHVMYVRDLLNCNEISQVQIIIDYPKYFTPNGDGYHDTWNIKGIAIQPNSKIYIFDRYGKLLKQLKPTGNGWDGTFNGNSLPSNDYWFVVEYVEPSNGKRKEFRAHFSLKR